mmetsp:Transcript_1387/g.4434  ORF Transcript_1387/g.4434 Transcript_1387/m.4434 type:complete len:241 (-) Transcript_1387:37-759(-)
MAGRSSLAAAAGGWRLSACGMCGIWHLIDLGSQARGRTAHPPTAIRASAPSAAQADSTTLTTRLPPPSFMLRLRLRAYAQPQPPSDHRYTGVAHVMVMTGKRIAGLVAVAVRCRSFPSTLAWAGGGEGPLGKQPFVASSTPTTVSSLPVLPPMIMVRNPFDCWHNPERTPSDQPIVMPVHPTNIPKAPMYPPDFDLPPRPPPPPRVYFPFDPTPPPSVAGPSSSAPHDVEEPTAKVARLK